MTPSDKITEVLQGVRELADKATEGPWEVVGLLGMTVVDLIGPVADCHQQHNNGPKCKGNAAFIAASRDILPRLVAALEHSIITQRILRDCAVTKSRSMYQEKRDTELAAILTGDKP